MILKTNKILLFTGIIIALIILIASIPTQLGLEQSDAIYFAFLWILVFGINVAGLVIGVSELNRGKRKAIIGIIGNSVLILIFLTISIYALLTI